MIPTQASALQALLKAGLPLIEVATPEIRLPAWQAGQQVVAEVKAALSGQRFLISADGATLEAKLPAGTQVGQRLPLTFVSADPRPVFLLDQTRAPNSPQVSMSDTARFVSQLLARSDASPARAPAPASPLLAETPVAGPVLAKALASALTSSGLFYESHQAQWVAGQRPLEQLLEEPQGQLSGRIGAPAAAAEPPAAAAPTAASAPAPNSPNTPDIAAAQPFAKSPPQVAPATAGPVASASSRSADTETTAVATKKPEPALTGVDSRTIPVVREQVRALETRKVMWQGEVWPGQTMRWEVEEREGRGETPQQMPAPEWRTRIELELPRLGRVAATIDLERGGLSLDFAVGRSDTANLLSRHRAELVRAFEAAGLATRALAVRSDGK